MVENTILIFHDDFITEEFVSIYSPKYTDITIQKISAAPTAFKMKLSAVYFLQRPSETFEQKLYILSQIRGKYHKTLMQVSSQAMVCLCGIMEHGSLYYSRFLHGLYLNGFLYGGLRAAPSALSNLDTIKD